MAGSKYIPDFLEKYINKDVARQQELSKIMKSDSAILSKTPEPDTTQGDYFMGKNKGYYVPGAPVEKEGLLLPQTGSTISQARLDVISPKITRTEDNQADHEKNIAILDDLQKKGKLTLEDQQFIKEQQAKGVSKYDIAGDLVAKKRYQLGTRQVVIPTVPGKPASLAVNKKNLYSVYDKSEIDNFINSQPTLPPETQEWVKQQKQQGKTSEDIKSELFSQHLQRNLENYIWSKKGVIEKAIDTTGLAITAGANDLVLGTGAFLLDLLSKAPGLGGVKKGKDFLNQLSESNKSNLARNLGISPGDQIGDSDISYEGAKIAGAILSLFVPTGAGSALKYVGKLPKVEKGLEFLGSFGNTKVAKTFKEASEAISAYLANPNNAKNAARAEWVIKSLKESTIMSGRTSVRSGEVPSAGEFAIQTGAFAAGDLAFQGAGKYLGKMLPERLQLTNIVNAGDLQKSSERLARLYGKEADVTDVARWNLDRGIRGTGKQQRQQINNWVEKSIIEKDKALSAVKQTFSDDTIKSLQKALSEKLDIYTDKGIATAGNEEKVAKFIRLIEKEKLSMKEVEEARGLLAENLFTKQGTMKEVASKEGWQKVWVDASKWMENKLPGIRAVNKDIEVGIAQAQAIAKKEATNAAKQIASYLGFSGLTGTGVGVYTGDWKKGLAVTTLGFGSAQLVKMLRSPLVMSNIAYYLNKLSPQARKVMNALKNGDRIGVDDALKVLDEIKLLPPPSGKPLSVQNVKGEVVAPTGVMTGKVSDKDIIKASNLGNTKSKYTGETMKTQPQEMPKQEVKKGLLKTLSNSSKVQKGKVQGVKEDIPSKKVNNPIIQKLAKKQETVKTPQVDTELASLQKQYETLPGVPKVEVPADYVPKNGLPTGAEFESTILPTKTKTNKIPSPDVKRPQIRGIDLGIRSNMIDSLKQEGIFTDSFFAITDKNLSKKFIDYAEQKAIKKGISTSGKEVSIRQLLDTAKNSADTVLTPTEYVKGLDGDKGIYLRFDISDGNKVAINSSYADIFFKNFDDVTFKGSNEVSPVIVYSKGKDVGLIMPIKDPYGAKEVLGDFAVGKPKIPTPKTPQVEGKTALPIAQNSNGIDFIANEAKKYKTEAEFIDSLKKKMSSSILPDDFYPKKYKLPKDGGMGRAEALIKSTEESLAQSKKELGMARNKNRIEEIKRSIKRQEEELQTKIDDLNRYNNEKKSYDDAMDKITNKDKVDAVIRNGKATESDRELLTFMLENRDKPVEFWTDIYKQSKPKHPLPLSSKSEVKYSTPDDSLIKEARKTSGDKIPKHEESFLTKYAEGKTLDEFMGLIRGSSTQYSKYEPRLRRYLRPESKRISDFYPEELRRKAITVYRGIDKSGNSRIKSEIKGGDFVTTSYDDALSYADSPANVVSKRVPISTLVTEFPDEFLKANKNKNIDSIVDYELIWKPIDHPFYKLDDKQLLDIYNKANKK